MNKNLWLTVALLISSPAWASAIRTIDADALRSSDHVNTLTLPSATDTLIARNTTDTLQNKTLSTGSKLTSAVTIVDATDATKVWAFSLSGMTTAKTLTLSSSQTTTQTLTIPNVGSGDTIATLLATQALQSKTIDGSLNTLSKLPVATQMIQAVVSPFPNSSATSFTLSTAPGASVGVSLYLDGVILIQGAGQDYTISGSTITMAVAPATGQKMYAVYSQY